jgi:ubiquinone/menaquinone biosynthesis C-methylase UbiE
MSKRTSAEQFDQQASHYNAQWNKWSEASLNWLLEHAHGSAQDLVLDVATGTGFTALAFAARVKEVVGLDVSEGMLAQARANAQAEGLANVTFEKGAAESLPFPDASFDKVTCRVAPHHFLSVEQFCAEAYRVLKPGGKLLIADTGVPDRLPEVDAWQNQVEALRDTSHVRNYSLREWRKLVETAGFNVEESADLEEEAQMGLEDWMKKSGCAGESAARVRKMFTEAPEEARRVFSIAAKPDGDVGFRWLRVVLAARKTR